jgi:hypothetical protein
MRAAGPRHNIRELNPTEMGRKRRVKGYERRG